MAHGITVDTTVLRDQGSRLGLLAADFHSADAVADLAEEAVGVHPDTEELRHQLNGFSSSWRIRREGMQGDIDTLRHHVEHVAGAFEDADTHLLQVIDGSQDPVDFGAGSVGNPPAVPAGSGG